MTYSFNNNVDPKFNEFNHAINKYSNHLTYKNIERLVSLFIVILQTTTLLNLIYTIHTVSYLYLFFSLVSAYLAADFINGLVHMYMDNNTNYTSIFGPYIAAFHLHHAKYVYRVRPLLKIYFDESGTKFWLLAFLLILVTIQLTLDISKYLNCGLVAFSFFSTIAELSHYWCHNATESNKFIFWLQKNHLLLSKKHHKAHHCSDNIQYAFLNGATDPLINFIARHCYKGYKNFADKHTSNYIQQSLK